jgi:hypothetical protein
MATRAMGPLAGIGWLKNAINLGRHNPKAIFGGAALVLLLSLLPSLATLPIQLRGTPEPAIFAAMMGLLMLAGLLLRPLFGGMLGIIHATEQGRPAKATDVFAAYRHGGGWLRLVGFGVLMLALYAVALAAIVAVAGTDIYTWYVHLMMQGAKAHQNVPLQLPTGFWVAMAMGSVLWLLICGIYAVGFTQAALTDRPVIGAIRDGVTGALKNLLPLVTLVVVSLIGGLVLMLVFVLAILLLAVLAKFVGIWLIFVVMVPLYIGFALALYVVMLGVMYYMWRDVCGEQDQSQALPEVISV